ncbi:MAG: hypothetical protein EA376_10365 [Phycisphaeraceae bacterium]|nr:MAG: hypothetical protein EA376_10365 [Phycisphaeraceae bacterium]
MAEEAAQPQKKKSKKTVIVVLGLLVAEAVAVVAVFSLWVKPGEVRGQGIVSSPDDHLNQLHEVLIVNDRFPNHHTGRVWLWDTEIQIQVRQKHADFVRRLLEERNAEIKTSVSQIIRTAHHNHMKEPNLETLNRQLLTALRGIFGEDASGDQRVVSVLIPKCVGFPADF